MTKLAHIFFYLAIFTRNLRRSLLIIIIYGNYNDARNGCRLWIKQSYDKNSNKINALKANVIFMSPSWGGPGYSLIKCYSICALCNDHVGEDFSIFEICVKLAKYFGKMEIQQNIIVNGKLNSLAAFFENFHRNITNKYYLNMESFYIPVGCKGCRRKPSWTGIFPYGRPTGL
ncbi:Uncharacterized protein FWK35_00019181 [Aphis craccivora]|uniref:Trimethylguanosine synthase n=1 Tax=Aphis craccivora TaxID=307492 RepID=A0A6G0Y714_APHCR|nr:Uncharacterized protein FWK35_00019181 [Aphis craccivora]